MATRPARAPMPSRRDAALAVLLIAACALLAGCSDRPLAASATPTRPSGPAWGWQPFAGELHWLDLGMQVTPAPALAGSVASPGEPYNCFVVRDPLEEQASFLGGVSLNLTWMPGLGTEALAVDIVPLAAPSSSWSTEGPSPLHWSFNTTDSDVLRTPFMVQVRPATPLPVSAAVPVPVQVQLVTGLLESTFEVGWQHCEATDLPPVPPPAAGLVVGNGVVAPFAVGYAAVQAPQAFVLDALYASAAA
jgi:hypothetical protein